MLNFALCDDNVHVLEKLSKMLESIFIKHNLEAQVSYSTTSANDMLEYVQTHPLDVIFLDIDLKSPLSGLALAGKVRKNNKSIYIIFTTGHYEYVGVAYKYKTFDFISKPFTTERLEETITRLVDDIFDKPKKFIRLNNKNTIISEDSVQYIKKDGVKTVFFADNRTYETYGSFNKMTEELPENFIRCHKSYIVNLNRITNVYANDNVIVLGDQEDQKCYIGPKYKNHFMEVLNNYGNFKYNLDSTDHTKRDTH